jgi:hypothetical protein
MNNTKRVLRQEYARRYPQRRDPNNPWVGDTIWIPQVRF